MPKLLKLSSLSFLLISAVFLTLYINLKLPVLFLIFVISGLTGYHLAIRLFGGTLIDMIFKNKMNYNRFWFKEHFWVKSFYKLLNVKKWKDHLPTYDPSLFDFELHTYEEIVMAMCQAEIVHESNMVLSYVPLILIPFSPTYLVYTIIISSICASLIDSIFVMTQRYNRPRLIRLMKLKRK